MSPDNQGSPGFGRSKERVAKGNTGTLQTFYSLHEATRDVPVQTSNNLEGFTAQLRAYNTSKNRLCVKVKGEHLSFNMTLGAIIQATHDDVDDFRNYWYANSSNFQEKDVPREGELMVYLTAIDQDDIVLPVRLQDIAVEPSQTIKNSELAVTSFEILGRYGDVYLEF